MTIAETLHPRLLRAAVCLPLLALALALAPAAQGDEDGWTLAKNEDGVEIYTREVAGSVFKEFRGTARVPAPLAVVVDWYQDPSTYTEWIDRCAEARRVESSPGATANYLRFDFPFPATDRDVVLRGTPSVTSPTERVFEVENVDGSVPETSGVVRVPMVRSRWVFRSHGDDATDVIYSQHMDAGGKLPAFLVNRAAVDNPHNTLRGLARYAARNYTR